MAGRKIRDAAEAELCLAAAARSGLERRDWARAHGVDARSLNAWWLNLGGRRTRREEKPTRLRLVEMVPEGGSMAARYIVRVGRAEVECDGYFDEGVLQRLLAVVASC